MSQAQPLAVAVWPGIDTVTFSRACDTAASWPLPGQGQTQRRFELLWSMAENDLVLGRLVEAHADATAITVELDVPLVGPGQRWGVWAAGPADSLCAYRDGDRWRLEGRKAWCSGAGLVTHALVDAAVTSGQQLFAVDLNDPGVVACPSDWVGPGMARADTRSVRFHRVSALPVGGPGQYVARPGFWAGAIGVAACWHGGTTAVSRVLLDRTRHRPEPHLLAHLGAVFVALEENRAVLSAAATELDQCFARDHELLAGSVRTTVERNAAEIIDRVGRALGPAPLAHDGDHAALVADLTVYTRQHHGERDLEQMGRLLSQQSNLWSS